MGLTYQITNKDEEEMWLRKKSHEVKMFGNEGGRRWMRSRETTGLEGLLDEGVRELVEQCFQERGRGPMDDS